MKAKTKKILTLAAAIAVCAAIAITGTFAWYSAQQTALNKLGNTNRATSVVLVEDFDPLEAKDFYPGVEVDKYVSAVQTGDGFALVRIRFEESLLLYEADDDGVKVFTDDDMAAYLAANTSASASDFVPKTITEKSLLALLKAYNMDNGVTAIDLDPATTTLNLLTWADVLSGDATVDTTAFPAGAVIIAAPDVAGSMPKSVTTPKGPVEYYPAYIVVAPVGDDFQTAVIERDPMKIEEYADPDFLDNFTKLLDIQFEWYLPKDLIVNVHDYYTPPKSAMDTIDHTVIELTFNDADIKDISDWDGPEAAWFFDADGWFYWGMPLGPGEATAFLLEKVGMVDPAPAEYEKTFYQINVRMQAIEVSGAAIDTDWTTGTFVANTTGDFEIDTSGNTFTSDAKTAMNKILPSIDQIP